MSKKTPPTKESAKENMPAPAPESGQDENAPRLQILAQYVRDLSFENPGAPNFRLPEGEQPEMKISISVDVRESQGDNKISEVGLKINATLAHKDAKLFIAEMDYTGLVQLENIPEDNKRPILLVEVPRQLFPFARKILHDVTRDGGWPPVLLDPIDFMQLYRAEQEKKAKEQNSQALPDLPNV